MFHKLCDSIIMFVFSFQPVETGPDHNFITADVNSFPVKRENGKSIYKQFYIVDYL